ncbi:Glycosylphosphatidylinositol-mannosyltransferase I, PIG-X/PBN1 [Phytophthora cinnamomi]|uniref:Glycosylphosphatidylinositol-mannosyltransferase I, PIG-X/PBN1 n=1 Tax=Phytophthora cinnamomi TaxID=4785 RepID=UPI003559A5BE|nr:Glycosylphosphatidylinositol-mannosyltransferase I, PIG-X/PBN1 [Phytophthora cinnamomi]
MRRWTIPLLGVLAAGAGAAASPSTLALWPQHLDAELSVSHAAGDQTIVEASHGGALGTFNTKIDAPSEVQLDPLIDAVDVSWVPASDAQSSVFDRFVANLPQFDRVHAEGIHLQVKLREGASWGDLNETHRERIETNVRGVLQSALPTLEIRPDLSRGFLARSFCDYRAWKTNNPMQETLREPTAGSSRLCYSSSFPLASKNESDSFFNRILDSPNSKVERGLAEAKRGFSFSFIRREHRFAMVTVGRSSVSSPTIEVEYLETWVAKKLDAESWRTVLRLGKLESSLFIVASVKQDADLYTIQYVQLQRESKLPQSLSVVNIQVPMMTATASVQTTIAGEGFHRRYVMDVKTMEHGTCAKYSEDQVLLVRIPVSNTAYLDLDEIRRMERFGELKLLSFTKHIEIERPSPVSAQHVVGLEFAVPATNQVHLEYPIHFRYQAPSENDLYRQSYVIAPDIFLFCRDAKRSAVRKPTQTRVDAASNFFQTWGLTGYADQVISSGDARWFRLATTSPLPVTEVLTPVGYLPSGGLVSSVTLLFASMGAALLLWVSAGVAKRTQMPSTASWKAKAE